MKIATLAKLCADHLGCPLNPHVSAFAKALLSAHVEDCRPIGWPLKNANGALSWDMADAKPSDVDLKYLDAGESYEPVCLVPSAEIEL